MLPARNIAQTTSERNKDVIRKSYPDDKQYLAFPDTSARRKHLHTFARRISGLGSWRIIDKVALLLITWILKDPGETQKKEFNISEQT